MRRTYLLLCFLLLAASAGAQSTTDSRPPLQASQSDDRFKLYPLRANAYINIDIEWPEMRAFTIAIYNSKDILQHEWKEKAAQSYQKALSLDKMPEGNYYIVVKTRNEAIRKDFTVSRSK